MQAALFDMDGVVVDSERYWVEREASAILPETVEADVAVEEITGMNVTDLYEYLAERYSMRVDREGFIDRYDAAAEVIYAEETALLGGLPDLLSALHERGVLVGLVSSSPTRWIELVLDRFDLRGVWDVVASADHVARGKPDPDVYLHAADRLGVAPEECVAVEDSAHGVESATAAGTYCIGLLGHANSEAAVAEADAVASDSAELRRLLLARATDG